MKNIYIKIIIYLIIFCGIYNNVKNSAIAVVRITEGYMISHGGGNVSGGFTYITKNGESKFFELTQHRMNIEWFFKGKELDVIIDGYFQPHCKSYNWGYYWQNILGYQIRIIERNNISLIDISLPKTKSIFLSGILIDYTDKFIVIDYVDGREIVYFPSINKFKWFYKNKESIIKYDKQNDIYKPINLIKFKGSFVIFVQDQETTIIKKK